MHQRHEWGFAPGYAFVIALGFSVKFQSLLVDMAQKYAVTPSIKQGGARQPYVLFHAGIVRARAPLPGEYLDALMEDFPGTQVGSLTLEGLAIPGKKDTLCCMLESEQCPTKDCDTFLNRYRLAIAGLFDAFAENVWLKKEFMPYIRLGTGYRKDGVNGDNLVDLEYELSDGVPDSIAVGYVGADELFHRVTWLSLPDCKIVRGPEWKKAKEGVIGE